MKESKTSTKDNPTGKDKGNPLSELAQQAAKNYEQLLRAGVKLNEQAGEWWASMAKHSAPSHDWQAPFERMSGTMAKGVLPLAQKPLEETVELMEKNQKAGAELFKKAMAATQAPSVVECQDKWMDFWESSVSAAQSHFEELAQIQSRALNGWMNYLRRNTEVTSVRVPRAA